MEVEQLTLMVVTAIILIYFISLLYLASHFIKHSFDYFFVILNFNFINILI